MSLARLRILLTEGSSLSARQTLYALGPAGHHIDACDPRPPFCLARYSRFVGRCFRCPALSADPAGYLAFLVERLERGRYDVLLPIHDQVYLCSRFREELGRYAALPVPDFAAIERVQSKAACLRLLDELGLPHPPTALVRTPGELEAACRFPCYVKLAYSTAGCGVWLLRDAAELQPMSRHLEEAGHFASGHEILVQQPAAGRLGVVQSVFQQGRLLATHSYEARSAGVGGSASARIGASRPRVLEQVATIGAHLRWHGALMIDYLYDPATGQPAYIDANPRIGETFNAVQSGVNLCQVLLDVALDRPVAPLAGRPGVRTHNLAASLLAAAQQGATRRVLVQELIRAWRRQGVYAGSEDELTRPRDDSPSVMPFAWVVFRLLSNPRAAQALVAGAVDNYSLTGEAVERIRELGFEAGGTVAGSPLNTGK